MKKLSLFSLALLPLFAAAAPAAPAAPRDEKPQILALKAVPGESVTSRVDMLMASITAAFDMEAAIPQLIERAIYACYEDYGWSLDTNENSDYPFAKGKDGKVNYESGPFADGVFAFPTLSDVLKKTEVVVEEPEAAGACVSFGSDENGSRF